MRLAIALIAALLAAGCLGGNDATPTTPDDAGVQTAAVASTTPTVDGAANVAANGTAIRLVPVTWDGKVARWACVPSGPGSCMGSPVPLGEGDSFTTFDERPTRMDLTMTWSAETPATQGMMFYALKVTSCGENCFQGEAVEHVAGPSPLKIELALDLAEDETLAIGASTSQASCVSLVVLLACAQPLEQSFKVEGTLTVVEPAP